MLEELITSFNTGRAIKNEKESYRLVDKFVKADGFKIYSTVLRGFPDYIVTQFMEENLEPGFMEVKFDDRELRPSQVKVLGKLDKVAPCYLLRARPDGVLDLYLIQFN